ncbi:hypothetical protein D3C86_1364090 [compost metagenome]
MPALFQFYFCSSKQFTVHIKLVRLPFSEFNAVKLLCWRINIGAEKVVSGAIQNDEPVIDPGFQPMITLRPRVVPYPKTPGESIRLPVVKFPFQGLLN